MAVEFNPRLLKDKGQPSSKPEEVVFRPETYLAAGDGVKDDSAALYRMSQAVTEAGGGVIELRPGATYMIGGQELSDPAEGVYTFPPAVDNILEFTNCTKGLVIKGNGAKIKCRSGLKYGTFNTDGSAMNPDVPYLGVGVATPYKYMIYVHTCSGVHIENLELDGNISGATIGGRWGDTGRQIPMTGMFFYNNTGPFLLQNVHTHHHGLDGYVIDGPSTGPTDHKERSTVINVRSECNGRQACSIVGGKGWTFIGCSFNYTGKANAGSDVTGPVVSNPGCGIDFEAEAGKEVRDFEFINGEAIGNYNQSIVADSGTDVDRISFQRFKFVGTTGYALWLNRPGFKLYRCEVYGTSVAFWDGTSGGVAPQDAVYCEDTLFSNEAAQSPTGALFDVNDQLMEGINGFVSYVRCTFEHHLGVIGAGVGNASGISDHSIGRGPHYTDCKIVAKAGAFGAYGQFHGTNYFIEDGGVIGAAPGVGVQDDPAEVTDTAVAGPSFGAWYFHRNGTTTQYPATHDGNLNGLGTRSYASDANLTVTHYTDKSTQVLTGTITADRTVTLSGGKRGATFRFVRTGDGAFNWSIGGLKNLAVDEWCEVEHSGSEWVLSAFGSL